MIKGIGFSLLGVVLTTSLMSVTSVRADDIYLGEPIYGGTGCPAGSAAAVLSPDSKSLSILFDKYQAFAGGPSRQYYDRKSCNVAIPVHVPQGLSVSVLAVDYRGFNSVPRGGYSRFNVEYFFAGSRGPTYARTFYGPVEDGYFIRNNLQVNALVWSRCGDDVILRTNSSIFVKTNGYYDDALSTVDSEDINAGIKYLLQWRRCN